MKQSRNKLKIPHKNNFKNRFLIGSILLLSSLAGSNSYAYNCTDAYIYDSNLDWDSISNLPLYLDDLGSVGIFSGIIGGSIISTVSGPAAGAIVTVSPLGVSTLATISTTALGETLNALKTDKKAYATYVQGVEGDGALFRKALRDANQKRRKLDVNELDADLAHELFLIGEEQRMFCNGRNMSYKDIVFWLSEVRLAEVKD